MTSREMIEYNRNSSRGNINNLTSDGSWIAVTIATSKSFKTRRGAERYMERMGYTVTR